MIEQLPRDAAAQAETLEPLSPAPTPRRVGVEIEFVGLTARAAAEALAAGLAGTLIEQDEHAFDVRGTRVGDLAVELDIRYAHPRRHDETLPVRLRPRAAVRLGYLLRWVVPRELITPPIPIERLPDVDLAVDVLRRAGARGRGTTWFGSLGLHFNVDPPRLDAATLCGFLKAFVLLEPWLRHRAPATRPWLPRFRPKNYPTTYVRQVAEPDYWPDVKRLADDYLVANPTRDRGLDLLPILLHLDPARVRAKLPFEKIGGRPVLHYRLPQAHVSDPSWSVRPDWTRWLAVERLAADRESLAALCSTFMRFIGDDAAWSDELRRRASDLLACPTGAAVR